MAEENETTEEENAPEETPGAEPAAEEAAPEEAVAEEAPTEEPAAEEAPAAEEEPAAEAPAADEPDEPQEQLSPKELRKSRRSQHTGEARPPRDAEARATERAESRAKAAANRRRYRAKHRTTGGGGAGTPPAEREPGAKKVRLGTVVSNKGDKTITVRVELVNRHRRYEKVIRHSDTLHAHDERNEAGEGDTVRVVESRPLSKTKRWRLVEVVEKAR